MSDCHEEPRALRVRPRRKSFQPAELDTAAGPLRVHVLDLSETGALIDAARPPALDSFVTLICGSLRRSARVAWVNGTRLGVRFVMPLSAAQVDDVLALGAAVRRRATG